jgi:hypothetical protein
MEKLPDLKQLSNEAKEALIVELWQEIQTGLTQLSQALSEHNAPKN